MRTLKTWLTIGALCCLHNAYAADNASEKIWKEFSVAEKFSYCNETVKNQLEQRYWNYRIRRAQYGIFNLNKRGPDSVDVLLLKTSRETAINWQMLALAFPTLAQQKLGRNADVVLKPAAIKVENLTSKLSDGEYDALFAVARNECVAYFEAAKKIRDFDRLEEKAIPIANQRLAIKPIRPLGTNTEIAETCAAFYQKYVDKAKKIEQTDASAATNKNDMLDNARKMSIKKILEEYRENIAILDLSAKPASLNIEAGAARLQQALEQAGKPDTIDRAEGELAYEAGCEIQLESVEKQLGAAGKRARENTKN